MIIDADCHVSPTPEGGVSITIDELLCRMDAAGVDRAVTWLQPPYRRDLDEANAYIHRATEDHPDRILGFGWADPNLGVGKAVDMVRRCLQEYGFYGVKLNGAQNAFFIDDPHLSLPVVEAVAVAGGILAFHVGADAFEQTHPFRVAKIARTHPNLPILVVHMGGVGHADLTRATIEFAAECPNLTLIGSAVRAPAVLAAIRTLGAERVCFGSDTPFDLMHVELARYRALLGGEVGDDEKAAVLGGNVARLFGLRKK
ncbi:MAG: amidohydrolase [Planctomycetes bacterium SM23_25]|nr:MAG: amidohydrolase [Planctomycetes bacterium SM23_25]